MGFEPRILEFSYEIFNIYVKLKNLSSTHMSPVTLELCMIMKWPRYRRVVSLEIQVGITSQINKWAKTDPRKYRRWDQVPRRSKHPMPTSHTRRESSSEINTSGRECKY
jgi:hypothetical protein